MERVGEGRAIIGTAILRPLLPSPYPLMSSDLKALPLPLFPSHCPPPL